MEGKAVKRFNVVIGKDDGGVELYPMKEWLRHIRESVPLGLDATTSTSHELRNGLKKMGWSVQCTDNEVRLVMPGAANLETNVGAVLGGEDVEKRLSPKRLLLLSISFGIFWRRIWVRFWWRGESSASMLILLDGTG